MRAPSILLLLLLSACGVRDEAARLDGQVSAPLPDVGLDAASDLREDAAPDFGVGGAPDAVVLDLGADAAGDFGPLDGGADAAGGFGPLDLGADAAGDLGPPDLGADSAPDLGADVASDLGPSDLGADSAPDFGPSDLGADVAPDLGPAELYPPDLGPSDLGADAAPDVGVDLGPPDVGAEPGQPARYLALGDSYTIGESVPVADRYPVQLAAALNAEAIPVAEPWIIARTGWSVAQLDAGIDAADPMGPFPLVTLLIGVNDQFRGGSPEAYEPAFRALLERALSLAGDRPCGVVVLSIPDWGYTPFGRGRNVDDRVSDDIDAFNAVNRAEAMAAGVAWVDVTAISRRGLAEPALVADDGLHPSGAMYAEWVDRALPAARAALTECPLDAR